MFLEGLTKKLIDEPQLRTRWANDSFRYGGVLLRSGCPYKLAVVVLWVRLSLAACRLSCAFLWALVAEVL